jgi:hypothetical protein
MLLQGAQRFLDLPDELTLEELQAGDVRAANTAPARHSGESKATVAEAKTNDNQHMLLTRLEKSRIAQHLQASDRGHSAFICALAVSSPLSANSEVHRLS